VTNINALVVKLADKELTKQQWIAATQELAEKLYHELNGLP
jgi:hypothetical protein